MNIRDNPIGPERKWTSDDGRRAMHEILVVATEEIRRIYTSGSIPMSDATRTRISNDYDALRDAIDTLRPIDKGAPKRFINWVRKQIPAQPPMFSMTFGQMFESVLEQRGCKPFSSGPINTFWTGSWCGSDELVEGYAIMTSPAGWDVVWREDRSKGLSWGAANYSARKKAPKTGWWTRKVSFSIWSNAETMNVYSRNIHPMSWSPTPYVSRYNTDYETAVEHVERQANIAADFMNDRDFHLLEQIKLQLRRTHSDRSWRSREEPVELDSTQMAIVGDAAVLTDQLHLPERAVALYAIWNSGRWDGGVGVDDDERPPNIYFALRIGDYPPKALD